MAIVNRKMFLIKGFWSVCLMVTPVLFYLGWINSFELPKIVFMGFFVSVTLFSLLFWGTGSVLGNINRKILVGWLGWILGYCLFSINNELARNWFWGEANRYQGFLFYLMIFFVFIFCSLLFEIGDRIMIGYGWFVSILATLIVGIYQLVKMNLGYYILDYTGRVVSSFGQPNNWADFVLVGLALVMFDDRYSKKFKMLTGGVSFLSVLLSGSRLGLVIWLVLIGLNLVLKIKKGVLVLVLVLIVSGWYSIKFEVWEERIYIWQKAVSQIVVNRGLGYGLGSLSSVLGTIRALDTNQSHNFLLDSILVGGWLSGAGVIFVIGKSVVRSMRMKNWGLLASLVTWVMLNSIHTQGLVNWMSFSIILAMIWSQKRRGGFGKIKGWQLGLSLVYGLGIAVILIEQMV